MTEADRPDVEATRATNEGLFRTLAEASPDMVYVIGRSGSVRYVNPAAARQFGVPPSALIGQSLDQVLEPETALRLLQAVRRVIETGRLFQGESEERFPAGTRWIDISLTPVRDAAGDVAAVMGISRDITERKQAETALRESEEKYRTLVERANDGIVIIQDGLVKFANPRLAQLRGSSLDEIIGTPIEDHVHPDDLPRTMERYRRRIAGEKVPPTFEVVLRRGDGSPFPAELNAGLITFNGRPADLIIIRDITGRKHAEEALHESEERFRLLAEEAPVGISLMGPDLRFEYLNPKFIELFGYTIADIPDKQRWFELAYPDAAYRQQVIELWREDLGRAPRIGEVIARSLVVRGRDGKDRDVLIRSVVTEDRRQMLTYEDITERKQAEAELRASKERYRELFERMGNAVAVYEARDDGQDFVIKDFNRSAERIEQVHREEILGRSILEVFPGVPEFGFFEVLQRVWRSGTPEHFPAGRYHDSRIAGWRDNYVYRLPTGEVVAVYDDVTERKQAEEELARYRQHLEELVDERTRALKTAQDELVKKEHLAALGKVAGSVAHEIRNPLAVIRNAVFFLKLAARDQLKGGPERHLEMIVQEINRANEIVTTLLDFAHGRPAERRPCTLEAILLEAVSRAGLPSEVKVTTDLPKGLPRINVDRSQVVQVFVNLLVNASQAMEGKGSITLAASQTLTPLPSTSGRGAVGEGLGEPRMTVTVTDTGPGIRPEVLPRLFEPLFSTKSVGAGLGLPISKSFLEANHGTIDVSCEAGKGATFIVALPLAAPPDR